jgi:hypothetical protein
MAHTKSENRPGPDPSPSFTRAPGAHTLQKGALSSPFQMRKLRNRGRVTSPRTPIQPALCYEPSPGLVVGPGSHSHALPSSKLTHPCCRSGRWGWGERLQGAARGKSRGRKEEAPRGGQAQLGAQRPTPGLPLLAEERGRTCTGSRTHQG